MAKLPALVTALAATDGRERVTLDLIARLVREKGLIVTTKSGRAAANMTPSDAVSLLIGANAVQHPKWAAAAAQQYRTFKQSPHGRREKGRVFGRLAAADTLADALAVLVEDARTLDARFIDQFERAYERPYDPEVDWTHKPSLQVLFTPGSVDITFNGPNESKFWRFHPDVNLTAQRFYTTSDQGPGRRVTTTVLFPTFLALHDALYGKHETAAGSGTGAP